MFPQELILGVSFSVCSSLLCGKMSPSQPLVFLPALHFCLCSVQPPIGYSNLAPLISFCEPFGFSEKRNDIPGSGVEGFDIGAGFLFHVPEANCFFLFSLLS